MSSQALFKRQQREVGCASMKPEIETLAIASKGQGTALQKGSSATFLSDA